jgi:hypothetical protein
MYIYWHPTITLLPSQTQLEAEGGRSNDHDVEREVAAVHDENQKVRGAIIKVSLQRERLKLKRDRIRTEEPHTAHVTVMCGKGNFVTPQVARILIQPYPTYLPLALVCKLRNRYGHSSCSEPTQKYPSSFCGLKPFV